MTRILRTLSFLNGFSIDLLGENKRVFGLGEVRYGQTLLRAPSQPWCIYAESDAGWRFDTFVLDGIDEEAEGITIVLSAIGAWNPRIQDGDAMGDSRFVAPRLRAPQATLRWSFRPTCEHICGNEWNGLAMRATLACPGAPVNWLLESATWEIGGAAAGCTLIQQDVSTIDLEQTVCAGSAFSTIEKFFTQTAGAWGGSYPMDMLPRAAGASILDFQIKDDLALCLFSERPGLTRARLDKYADEDVIHYLDRPFFPLSESAAAPERKLLVYRHPQPLKRHEWRNLWLDCFTDVRARILGVFDFHPEEPRPAVHAHLWDKDLKERDATWTDDLKTALADWARLGFRDVFTHGVWESATSDPGRREDEGNICCPYSFRFAERFGGATGMRALNEAAVRDGVEIFQWYGFQFARYAPLWKEHPEWLLREQHGDPWDGQYGVLWCGRMRSEFGAELLRQIRAVQRDTGIKGMFIDSYQNLGVTCVDWQGKDKAPQAEEIWRMQAALQKEGARFRCEVVTIFGVSQVSMFGFHDDPFRRRLWDDLTNTDAYFTLLDCSPGFFSQGTPFCMERISPQEYFRLAAHRAIPAISADPWHGKRNPGGALAEEYGRVNRQYNAALPRMRRLRLVEGGGHALWLDENDRPAALWTFSNVTIKACGALTPIESQPPLDTKEPGTVHLPAFGVYLID